MATLIEAIKIIDSFHGEFTQKDVFKNFSKKAGGLAQLFPGMVRLGMIKKTTPPGTMPIRYERLRSLTEAHQQGLLRGIFVRKKKVEEPVPEVGDTVEIDPLDFFEAISEEDLARLFVLTLKRNQAALIPLREEISLLRTQHGLQEAARRAQNEKISKLTEELSEARDINTNLRLQLAREQERQVKHEAPKTIVLGSKPREGGSGFNPVRIQSKPSNARHAPDTIVHRRH